MAYFPKNSLVNDFGVPNFLRQGAFDDLASYALQDAAPAGWNRYVDGRFNSVTVDTTGETLGATGIGTALPNGTPVRISGSAIPGGLAANTTYFVVGAAANTIQLAASLGGAAINITSTGTAVNVWPTQPLDGTGGSGSGVQNAVITSNPLRGRANWQIGAGAVTTGGGGYSTDFTLSAADQGNVNSISFMFRAGSAYSAGQLEVYIIADPAGTPFLITPSIVDIPGGSGMFQATFNATSASTYRLCIHAMDDIASTTNWTLDLDDIRIEPRVTVQGAAISDWQSFTPVWRATTTNPTFGTVVGNLGRWRRIGDSAQFDVSYTQSTSGTAGTGTYYVELPLGLQVDETKVSGTGSPGANGVVGSANLSQGTGSNVFGIVSTYAPSSGFNGLFLRIEGLESWAAADTPNFGTSNLRVGLNAIVPIVGWSSNITLANSYTEFAFNTSTTDADDNTSFGYGAAGTIVPTITVASGASPDRRTKRVRFQTPIQPTDVIIIESQLSGSGPWVAVGQSSSYASFTAQAASEYGINFRSVSGSTTDIEVDFWRGGRFPSGATYASAGAAYPENPSDRWRVRKSAGQNPGESLQRLTFTAHRAGVDQTGVNPNNNSVQILMTSVIASTASGVTRGNASLPGFNTSTGSFTAPYTGMYRINYQMVYLGTNVLASQYTAVVTKGASFATSTGCIIGNTIIPAAGAPFRAQVSGDIYMVAGELLHTALLGVGNNSASTLTMRGEVNNTYWTVEYIGPA